MAIRTNIETLGSSEVKPQTINEAHIVAGAIVTDHLNSALSLAATQIAAGAAYANGSTYNAGHGLVLCDKIALATVDTGGGIFAWAAPFDCVVVNVFVDVTTAATAACVADIGTTTVNATTSSDNLLDGIDLHTATGLFTLADQAGANGKTRQRLASGKWVTASKDTGASAGLVGNAYIHYFAI